jgi:putative sigma-54 modulation protein
MAIEITARHMNATEQIQDYARRRAGALLEAFPRVEHIHVILDVEKHRNIAEVVVQAKHHIRAEAEQSSDTMVISIDAAMDKIERQLQRLRDKIHDHKPAMKREEGGRARGVPQ